MTLKSRVVALVTGTAALVLVLAGVPLALMLSHDARDSATQEATYAAQGVADYLSTRTYDATVVSAYLDRLNRRGATPVAVELADGTVVGESLQVALPRESAEDGRGAAGDHDRDDNLGLVSAPRTSLSARGQLVEVDSQTPRGEARVFALVPDTVVHERIRARYLITGLGAALLLAVAWLAAEVTGRRVVRPLQRTADTALALSSGDLAARAPTRGPPEVARVAVELNALADRIDELLAGERESAADLSHRLRTPLTAVRLSVEGLPAGEARDELEAHVATLERGLTHVIRSARQGLRGGVHPRCDLVAVVSERVNFWSPLAEDQGRTIALHAGSGPVWVRASPDDLGAALDALMENVFAHTPEGTGFAVVVRATADAAEIDVLDEGPGIPARALVRGVSDGSTGLGLDIARATAAAGGGSLTLVRAAGRNGVRLTLPTTGHLDD